LHETGCMKLTSAKQNSSFQPGTVCPTQFAVVAATHRIVSLMHMRSRIMRMTLGAATHRACDPSNQASQYFDRSCVLDGPVLRQILLPHFQTLGSDDAHGLSFALRYIGTTKYDCGRQLKLPLCIQSLVGMSSWATEQRVACQRSSTERQRSVEENSEWHRSLGIAPGLGMVTVLAGIRISPRFDLNYRQLDTCAGFRRRRPDSATRHNCGE
jgi:hypothetical protein